MNCFGFLVAGGTLEHDHLSRLPRGSRQCNTKERRRPPIVKTRQPNVQRIQLSSQAQYRIVQRENPVRKQIQMNLTLIALLCGVIVMEALAQKNVTSSSHKMSSQQMMDKLTHMPTSEKTAMFDEMTNDNKMEAMRKAGHDISRMSHQESIQMMTKLTPEQKADMFDKMPMDTRMATMRIAMKRTKRSNDFSGRRAAMEQALSDRFAPSVGEMLERNAK
jgi:hypothetical protein